MKKIFMIMLVLLTIGVVSAAVVKVDADTQIRGMEYKPANAVPGSPYTFGDTGHSFRITTQSGLGQYKFRFEFFDPNCGQWGIKEDFVSV